MFYSPKFYVGGYLIANYYSKCFSIYVSKWSAFFEILPNETIGNDLCSKGTMEQSLQARHQAKVSKHINQNRLANPYFYSA
jgi:hypothetical protein